MTFRMGKRVATEMHLGNKEVYQVRQGEALVYAKQLTVSQTLDGVTSDAPSSVAWGERMVVTLVADSDTQMSSSSVVVTMGGVDVTSTAYDSATNTITIASVTGNVAITAAAMEQWEELPWTAKHCYKANAIGNTPSYVSGNNYDCIKVAAQEGDKFKVTGTGGVDYRLWMWTNSQDVVIDISSSSASAADLILTAPASSAYLIVNARMANSKAVYKKST